MTYIDKARVAWGDDCPHWVIALADACDHASQKTVAERIGYSPAVVNTVLKGKYNAGMAAVEQAVRGALLAETVDCPVYGDLEGHRCLEYQRRKFAATNPTRVRLYRTCRTCVHNKIGR